MRRNHRYFSALAIAVTIAIGTATTTTPAWANGPFEFDSAGGNDTYDENFNSLGTTTISPWVNDDTLAHWHAETEFKLIFDLVANAGTGTAGNLYNYGAAVAPADADRALGALGSGLPAGPGKQAFGAHFKNNSVEAITQISVAYTAEQWRRTTAAANTTFFYYRVGGTTFDLVSNTAAWTAVSQLNMTATDTSTSGALNPPTTEAISHAFAVSIDPGAEFWIGWLDPDDTGADQGLAVDDLTVTVQFSAQTPPQITSTPSLEVFSGNAYSYVITTSGLPAPTVGVTGLPSWLSYDAGTRTISGTPGAGDVGVTGTITVTATNGVNPDATQNFTITVWPTLAVGDVMIVGFNATDPDGFAFVTFVDLPGNLVLRFTDNSFTESSTFLTTEGIWMWTAPAGGVTAGTVVVVTDTASLGTINTSGNTALANGGDQIFVYQGLLANSPNLIFGINFANAGWLTVGTATTNSSYLPPALNVTHGNIDMGALTIDRNGEYTAARDNRFTLPEYKADIADLANWTTTFDVNITLATTAFTTTSPVAPSITSTAETHALPGTAYSTTITVTGNPPPTVNVTGLPAWLNFDAGTNTISGTPAVGDVGTTGTITITAENGINPDATQEFAIVVDPLLNVGDVMIVGINTATPNGFAFVPLVNLPGHLRLVFTDDSFGGGANFLGGESTWRWTAPAGGVTAGTVIIVTDAGGANAASVGTLEAAITGLSNAGDQIFVYQGNRITGPNLIFGINFANTGWRTSGTADAETSYLPADLTVTAGNIDLAAQSNAGNAQYTGTRNARSTLDAYKTDIAAVAQNWTFDAANAVTLDGTAFVTDDGSGGSGKKKGCAANGGIAGAPMAWLLLALMLALVAMRRRHF